MKLLTRLWRLFCFMPFLLIGCLIAVAIHLTMWIARQLLGLGIWGLTTGDDAELNDFLKQNEGIVFWSKWIEWSVQHFWH